MRERERRKRASSLIQMAHEDTVEQKAEEDKENEDGKRVQLRGERTERTRRRV